MLDAFIIEEIKRRERARREERERPSVELPVPSEDGSKRRRGKDDEKPPRGVVIIDL